MVITKDTISLADELAQKATLFEAQSELDHFLNEIVTIVANYTGADMAAIFLFDHVSGELVFKAGIDRGDLLKDRAGEKDPTGARRR